MKKILLMLVFFQAFFSTVFAQQVAMPVVKDVVVEGNSVSNKYVVINNLNLKNGALFNPSSVSNGIKYLYKTNMYKDIKVLVKEVGFDSVIVKVRVTENPRVDTVKVEGNDEIDDDDIIDTVTVKSGLFLGEYVINESKRLITDMYEDEGYSFVDVTDRIEYLADSSRVNVVFVINEGKKVAVKEIVFKGNDNVDAGKLKDVMTTREEAWWRFWGIDYKEDSLKADVKKIEEHYSRIGFLDAEVKNYDVAFDDEKKATITVDIAEGKQYFFGDISFVNNSVYDSTILKKSLGFKKGEPFDVAVFDKSVYAVTSLYSEKGYLYSNVTPKKVYNDSLINVQYEIAEGNPAYIHRVIIKGNTKTRDYVIRREITVQPGQIYKQSRIFRSQTRVAQLNFFNNVIPDVQPFDSNSVDIVFTVEEKETGQISAGLQYSETGLAGTLGLSIPNIAGTGKYGAIDVEYGGSNKKYSVSFTEPWILDMKKKTSVGGELAWQLINQDGYYGCEYDYLVRGGSLFASRRVEWPDDFCTVALRYSLNNIKRYNIYDPDTTGYYKRMNIIESKLKFSVSRNTTDWPQFPTDGSYLYYSPELAGKFLGGDAHYVKQTIIANWFYPSLWKFVFELKTKFAILTELPGNDGASVLADEKFSVGGNSYDGILRGYSTNEIGPGNMMYLLRLNYRFPIVEKMLYSSVFYDLGNVWDSSSDMDWMDLKRSAGFGFRASLPGLGVLGVDFGWGLDKLDENNNGIIDDNDEESGYHWEIMINQEF